MAGILPAGSSFLRLVSVSVCEGARKEGEKDLQISELLLTFLWS